MAIVGAPHGPCVVLSVVGGLPRGACGEAGGLSPQAKCQERQPPFTIDLDHLQSLARWQNLCESSTLILVN
jgi:hypothetical protein